MKIRKVAYNIDFIHILTFKENYKQIIAPYFSYENLQYGIDNENTIHESIRLVFMNEGFTLQFRKDGATLIYEGDISVLRRNNAVTSIFLDIVDTIKKIVGFTKVIRHKITFHCVDLYSKEEIDKFLSEDNYLHNPFGQLKEFATVYEFDMSGKKCRLQFGNYSEVDIAKYDLTPFKTLHNSDLTSSGVGLMSQFTAVEDISSTSQTKFKQLIDESIEILAKYKK